MALIWRITRPLLSASILRMTSSPAIPISRPMASKGSRSSGTSRWIRLSISLSVLSIMRLPVVVLTTLYEPFSTIFLLQERTIAGATKTGYENVYYCPSDPLPAALASLLHRLLVLGVDVLDVLPDEALGIVQVVAALPEDVGGMEGRHRLDAFYIVPGAAVLGDPEVFVYDRLRRGAAEAEDDLRPDGLYLTLQVGVAGPYLCGLRLAVLETAALLDGGAALHDVRQVDLLPGQVHGRQDVVEELARPPDEGQSSGILVLAGSLADEHQGRVGIPCRENRVGAALRQVALGADGDLTGEFLQPSLTVFAALRSVEKTIQGSSRMLACLQAILHRRPGSPGDHLLRAD